MYNDVAAWLIIVFVVVFLIVQAIPGFAEFIGDIALRLYRYKHKRTTHLNERTVDSH
jgi:hypothetical protein